MSVVVLINLDDQQTTMSDSEIELIKKDFKLHQDIRSGLKLLENLSTSEAKMNFMMMPFDLKEEEILLIDREKDVNLLNWWKTLL